MSEAAAGTRVVLIVDNDHRARVRLRTLLDPLMPIEILDVARRAWTAP